MGEFLWALKKEKEKKNHCIATVCESKSRIQLNKNFLKKEKKYTSVNKKIKSYNKHKLYEKWEPDTYAAGSTLIAKSSNCKILRHCVNFNPADNKGKWGGCSTCGLTPGVWRNYCCSSLPLTVRKWPIICKRLTAAAFLWNDTSWGRLGVG